MMAGIGGGSTPLPTLPLKGGGELRYGKSNKPPPSLRGRVGVGGEFTPGGSS
jgi:hypothetical protein